MPARIVPELAPAHFWSRVDQKGACWEWMGARDALGYGHIRYLGRYQGVHRLAWRLTNGEPPDGMKVCHRCDNPPCVRPDHLFLGTQADNLADMVAKGRSRRQTYCKRSHELTPENIAFSKGKRHGCLPCARLLAAQRYARWIEAGKTPAEWKQRKTPKNAAEYLRIRAAA